MMLLHVYEQHFLTRSPSQSEAGRLVYATLYATAGLRAASLQYNND